VRLQAIDLDQARADILSSPAGRYAQRFFDPYPAGAIDCQIDPPSRGSAPFDMSSLARVAGALAGFLTAALLGLQPAGGQQVTEQDVKAAFLYNFTRFIDWPADTPPNAEPFRLCVIADEPIVGAIQRTMQGESVKGRPVQTVVPASPVETRTCQVLFVEQRQLERASPMLAAVRELPVLTVSDARGFAARGGAIEFLIEEGRVRFDVNTAAAKRAGLSISSRLLQVARTVDGVRR
jgi:hypothetical protein